MTDDSVDVIVVGAGAAGLQAAHQLAKSGYKVVVLEGRDRVGGRILTFTPKGWPTAVELGAEFIHGGNPALERLLRRARLRKRFVPEQHWLVQHGSRREIPDVWKRIEGVMKQIGPRYSGSFGEWLKQRGDSVSPEDRKLAETFVQGFQGAPLGQMSAHTLFVAASEDEEQSRIEGGYGALVEALTRRLSREKVMLHVRTVVQQIEWKRGKVVVRAGQRQWQGRAALVTVPLGVLRAPPGAEGAITFSPDLARSRQLWQKLTPGNAVRVVLRMRADVWTRGVVPPELRENAGNAFGFLHSDESFFPVWWAEAPEPIIVGWTGGSSAKQLAGVPSERIVGRAIQTLAKLLGCKAPALRRSIVDWCTHDWAADPLTRGAYSFSIAGLEDAPQRLAKPVAGTLFFAGEATADALELGTVHGALTSGDRAAREISRVLKRQRA